MKLQPTSWSRAPRYQSPWSVAAAAAVAAAMTAAAATIEVACSAKFPSGPVPATVANPRGQGDRKRRRRRHCLGRRLGRCRPSSD